MSVREEFSHPDEGVQPMHHHLMAILQLVCLIVPPGFLSAQTTNTTPLDRFGRGSVSDADISPDGSRTAVAGGYGITIWDTDTESILFELNDNNAITREVEFSPDGSTLAAGNSQGRVSLWNPVNGSFVRSLTGHTLAVTALEWSPDGTIVAAGSRNATVRLWDSTTGSLAATLSGAASSIRRIRFNSDGSLIGVTTETEQIARVYNSTTGALVHTLTGASATVWDIAFSTDGTRIATAASTPYLYDAATGNLITPLNGSSFPDYYQVEFTPDNSFVLAAGVNAEVNKWNASTGSFVSSLPNTRHPFGLTPDGSVLLSRAGTVDNAEVTIYNVSTEVELPSPAEVIFPEIFSFTDDSGKVLAVSPGNLSGNERVQLRVIELSGGTMEADLQGHLHTSWELQIASDENHYVTESINSGSFTVWEAGQTDYKHVVPGIIANSPDQTHISPDSTSIAHLYLPQFPSTDPPEGRIISVADASVIQTLSLGSPQFASSIRYSNDGAHVAVGTSVYSPPPNLVGEIRVFDSSTGSEIHHLTGHTDPLLKLRFSPDDSVLAAGDRDGVVRLWNMTNGSLQHTLPGHSGRIEILEYGHDGAYVYARGFSDTGIRAWNPATGTVAYTLAHSNAPEGLAQSPDGSLLATSSFAGPVFLWNSLDGSSAGTISAPSANLNGVAISSDNGLLAIPINDSSVRLYALPSATLLETFVAHRNHVTATAFINSEKELLTLGQDGLIFKWGITHLNSGVSAWGVY